MNLNIYLLKKYSIARNYMFNTFKIFNHSNFIIIKLYIKDIYAKQYSVNQKNN